MSASPAIESESHHRPYETLAAPDLVPLYDLVQVKGPEGQPLDAYRGVRRRDTSEIVSVVSSRYQLVQHREVAQAVHSIGEALEQPVADPNAPTFPREVIRLFAGGRRMEVRLVVGTRYELARGEAVYPGVRVMNSLDGSWAVRAEGTGVRIACSNQLYEGMNTLVELREVHLSSATDLLAMLSKAIHAILSRFKDAIRVYSDAMGEEMLAEDVGPALLAADLRRGKQGTRDDAWLRQSPDHPGGTLLTLFYFDRKPVTGYVLSGSESERKAGLHRAVDARRKESVRVAALDGPGSCIKNCVQLVSHPGGSAQAARCVLEIPFGHWLSARVKLLNDPVEAQGDTVVPCKVDSLWSCGGCYLAAVDQC